MMAGYLKPQQIEEATIETGVAKARNRLLTMSVLGFLAGAFIALGYLLYIRVTADAPAEWGSITTFIGAALFPVGLGIVLQDIPLDQRGSASSAFWVLGYALTAAGALGLGWVGELFGEAQAVSWFGAAIVVSAVLCAALHLKLSARSRRRGGEPLI